jgi:2-polyprenyl-6-methoxyphenol hydroxylase-like FAD-dependent oxidoreductase
MRCIIPDTDVAIIGGGLAGSTAAAMLGRADIRAMLIDSHPSYPPDLRCEKLEEGQVSILRKTGLA